MPIWVVLYFDDDENLGVHTSFDSEAKAKDCLDSIAEDHKDCMETEIGAWRFHCIEHMTNWSIRKIEKVL